MITFKNRDGYEVELCVRLPSRGLVHPGYDHTTPDDLARAYAAMSEEQALEMAKAYAALPDRPTFRSFDESFVKGLAGELVRNWGYSEPAKTLELRVALEIRDAEERGAEAEASRVLAILDKHAGPAPSDWARVIRLIRSRGPAPERPKCGADGSKFHPHKRCEREPGHDGPHECGSTMWRHGASPVDPVREASRFAVQVRTEVLAGRKPMGSLYLALDALAAALGEEDRRG